MNLYCSSVAILVGEVGLDPRGEADLVLGDGDKNDGDVGVVGLDIGGEADRVDLDGNGEEIIIVGEAGSDMFVGEEDT